MKCLSRLYNVAHLTIFILEHKHIQNVDEQQHLFSECEWQGAKMKSCKAAWAPWQVCVFGLQPARDIGEGLPAIWAWNQWQGASRPGPEKTRLWSDRTIKMLGRMCSVCVCFVSVSWVCVLGALHVRVILCVCVSVILAPCVLGIHKKCVDTLQSWVSSLIICSGDSTNTSTLFSNVMSSTSLFNLVCCKAIFGRQTMSWVIHGWP